MSRELPADGVAAIALRFLASGGKRLRPRLCARVFSDCGGQGDVGKVCEAVECFHKASLIHDDLQDGDTERYGRPAVWREYGIPVAVAVGDWLVAYGYSLIADSGFAAAPRMLGAASRAHLRLCEGQGDELLGRGEYVSICSRKTGEGFALAAELGALAAGADPTAYRAWAAAYGTLYQMRDDRVDGEGPADLDALIDEWSRRLEGLGLGRLLA